MAKNEPTIPGSGGTDYERYIRTDQLLSLQKRPEEMAHPEELLFQVTHQAAELWLKQIDYDIDRTIGFMEEGRLLDACTLLDRSASIIDLLCEQILILETMAPRHYHLIRINSLGRGSGQESPGFNRLLNVGERLGPVARKVWESSGHTPLEVLRDPEGRPELHRLVEAILGYDEAFMRWRFTHMKMAMRIIGSRVKSLKGVPVTQLESGTREPLFPELWERISDLTDEFRPEY